MIIYIYIYTHLELQCIVLTQHHDYVQDMKPGRQKEAAAGADICDLDVKQKVTDCIRYAAYL